MIFKNQILCKRCLMPESKPYIYFNDEGVCNLCLEYDVNSHKTQSKPLESDLIKLLEKHKTKGKYDCMVMCSGGKDSTSALYYMKKRYKLEPLAFTFDHGFEPDDALNNVKNAVEILNIDFILYKSSFIQDMFREIIKCGSHTVLCHPCSIWYMDTAFDLAKRFNIPIIVAGWTKGQSKNESNGNDRDLEFVRMAKDTEVFLKSVKNIYSKYKDFPLSMEEVIKKHRKAKIKVISPHWFLPYKPDEYVQLIQRELKWKPSSQSYPDGSTNCTLNYLSVYYSLKNYGYTHYHVEASKLIREGVILREEALEQLRINFNSKTLQEVAEKLSINYNDYK